jgi:hypothetical protein
MPARRGRLALSGGRDIRVAARKYVKASSWFWLLAQQYRQEPFCDKDQ